MNKTFTFCYNNSNYTNYTTNNCYNSIFEYNNKTLAEMSIDEINIISSRSKAIYDMQNYFEKMIYFS